MGGVFAITFVPLIDVTSDALSTGAVVLLQLLRKLSHCEHNEK